MDIAVTTKRHLPAADELRDLAEWNQMLADWRRPFSLEPDGSFIGA
jgi:hypothetical protein